MKNDLQSQALLDALPQIVWVTNFDASEILYYNHHWWEYTGLNPKTYQHADAARAVHPDDLPRIVDYTTNSVRDQEGFKTHYRLRSANGQYCWHLANFMPLTNSNGKIERWLGTAMNVDSLIEAQSRFEAFFEQSSLPMEIYNLEGYPQKVNQAWVELFDTTLDQLKGYNVLTDPQSIERGLTPLLKKAIDGTPVEVPPFFYDPKEIGKVGRSRYLEASFFPVKDQNDNVRELAMILKDVTEREMIQVELIESNSALESAVNARQELLNICSHELKTPLTSLRIQTQLFKRKINKGDFSVFEPDKVQRLLDLYDGQIERLIHLVDDMLDLTRINSGKMHLSKEKVVLSKLVLEVLDRCSDQLSAAGCTISTRLDSSIKGEWDKFRIEQVLVNLLTNAFKYGQGKPVSVSIEKSSDNKSVILKVSDEGPGIAPQDQARIFDRFERAISSSEVSGLGLGLFITREIVEIHGGTIRVESVLNQGSSFVVELPL